MRPTIQELERMRLSALSGQDADAYAYLCGELGIFPEDEFLCARGNPKKYSPDFSSLERRLPSSDYGRSSDSFGVIKPEGEIEPKEYTDLAFTALKLFPSGKVSNTNLRRRISAINRAGKNLGFSVEVRKDLEGRDLWDYVTKTVTIRAREFLEPHCPNYLAWISERNREILRARRDIR